MERWIRLVVLYPQKTTPTQTRVRGILRIPHRIYQDAQQGTVRDIHRPQAKVRSQDPGAAADHRDDCRQSNDKDDG